MTYYLTDHTNRSYDVVYDVIMTSHMPVARDSRCGAGSMAVTVLVAAAVRVDSDSDIVIQVPPRTDSNAPEVEERHLSPPSP